MPDAQRIVSDCHLLHIDIHNRVLAHVASVPSMLDKESLQIGLVKIECIDVK